MSSTRNLIDVKDAARMLGLARSTLYEWARFRRVPHIRLGDRLLFDPADLQAFVRRRRVPSLEDFSRRGSDGK